MTQSAPKMPYEELSVAEQLSLRPDQQKLFMESLSEEELAALNYEWKFWSRPKQRIPLDCECHNGDWFVWILLSGRGFGKTRTATEAIRGLVDSGQIDRLVIAGPTALDLRRIMVEGDSGLLNVFPPDKRPRYNPTNQRVTFHNGAYADLVSADEPERFRGFNGQLAWCDEFASWRYQEDAWKQMTLGIRKEGPLGFKPRVIITTTPKPSETLKNIVKDPRTHITRGTTYENVSNLSTQMYESVVKGLEGTRLGRQEIYGDILEEGDGLWKTALIDQYRLKSVVQVPPLARIVVAVDPAVTSGKSADETGIIVAGIDRNGHIYVLADKSGKMKPFIWATEVAKAYEFWKADKVIAETNNGGELVVETLRSANEVLPVKMVTASRGKQVRAEPIANLYERGLVHHVGYFHELERQMTNWDPLNPRRSKSSLYKDTSDSPDRMDALVWALTELSHNRFNIKRDFSNLPPF